MNKEDRRLLIFVGIFAVAMAFVESCVVIYLRRLYYPGGFAFPLSSLDPSTLTIEWIREASTLVMLGMVGFLAGKKSHECFAYFLWAFAIWDIFYYIWLEIILRWPASLFTWDLLFLIPSPWIGPVLAPLLCSITMIVFTLAILTKKQDLCWKQWGLIILGCVFVLYAFLHDYASLIVKAGFALSSSVLVSKSNFDLSAGQFAPLHFDWGLFLAGEVSYLGAIVLILIEK